MTDERRARILQIADELEEAGLEATNSAVYSRALGHRGDVVQVMRDRRRERNGGSVALLEAEQEDSPTALELQEDLSQLEASYDAWHLALERLWEIEQEGPLSEQNFSRKQWLEYQMVQNLQAQERVRPQLAAAHRTEAVLRAKEAHDALIPEVTALAEEVVDACARLSAALAALAAGFEAQSDPFFPFRSRDGHQQFDVLGGREELVNFVAHLFPSDFRSRDMLDLFLTNPVTVGRKQAALSESPRLHVFPPRVLDRYIAEMHERSEA